MATDSPARTTSATRSHPACGTTAIHRAATITSTACARRSFAPGAALLDDVGMRRRPANHGASPRQRVAPIVAHGRPTAPLNPAHPTMAAKPMPADGAHRDLVAAVATARPARPPPTSTAGPVSGTPAQTPAVDTSEAAASQAHCAFGSARMRTAPSPPSTVNRTPAATLASHGGQSER
jgi:hypothetical protein